MGDYINVETDLIGKYIERMMTFKESEKKEKNKIDENFLASHGFF